MKYIIKQRDCIDTITILVQDVGGPDRIYCPSQPNQLLVGMPSNGLWDGPGILSDSGLFDPGFSNGADSIAKKSLTLLTDVLILPMC